ncbi:hypothetical protein [Kurthia sibirica]|uniref:Uncharacterized protein n=1 Tax=Kurthia sibirica TaxID=202750 RepID=A0A2U3AKN8_9BACL|nr:hypothetical protein [Kurthia sibirica]PWI25074.1 hypothetical protein DEX24_10025 [Kurthia sibirica]GEK34240.1 hypothetical protein KSI01_17730 [Kurthia sibirica]
MKKIMIAIMTVTMFLLPTFCVEALSKSTIMPAEVLQKSIKKSIATPIAIVLPQRIPVAKNPYITAKTTSTATSYKVVYYALKKPTTVNSPQALHASKKDAILRITAKKYHSQAMAMKKIESVNHFTAAGKVIAIMPTVKGYQDAGAGSQWTSWKMGRWSLTSHTTTNRPTADVTRAQQIIRYLQKHQLPIPRQNGVVIIGEDGQKNAVIWQNGAVVYTLDYTAKALDVIQAATSLN